MNRARWVLPPGLLCLAAVLGAAALAGNPPAAVSPAATSPGAPPREARRAAADKAAALLGSDHWQDPFGFLLCDFLYRRYGVEGLSTSARRFEEFRAAHPEVAWVDVFRRLIDPTWKVDRKWLEAGPGGVHGLDRVTVLALYCDQFPVPADYRALLEKARAEGGYSLTHAALALIWLRENGCKVLDQDFEKQVIRETAALVGSDPKVTDLELEAAAMVVHLGRAELLPGKFLDEVVGAQQPDGGWAEDSGNAGITDWHPTLLALWYLLETEHPGKTDPMVPRARVPRG